MPDGCPLLTALQIQDSPVKWVGTRYPMKHLSLFNPFMAVEDVATAAIQYYYFFLKHEAESWVMFLLVANKL